MILIIEAVDAAGKTTTVTELNKLIPLSVMLKLSGAPKKIDTQEHMKSIYYSLPPFFDAVSKDHTVVLDRFCLSERIYSSMFKSYIPDYIDEYEAELVEKYDIVQVLIHPTLEVLKSRLETKRIQNPNEKQPDLDTLLYIRGEYLKTVLNNYTIPSQLFVVNDVATTPREIATSIAKSFNLLPDTMDSTYS